MSTAPAPDGEWNEPPPPIPFRRRRLAKPPRPLTPLLGRDAEVAAVSAMLAHGDARLITLLGPGGIGKTRLALSVAAEVAGAFDDHVAWAPVTTATTSEAVAAALAQAVGVTETGGAPAVEALKAALRDERLLLVVDNFEQALVAAPLLSDLLRACPELSLLVTSRALLRIAGEHPIDVPPLATEPDSSGAAEPPRLAPAVQLFAERAAGVSPAFALTPENTPVVAEICRRLDGLPLAIELAGERSLLLSPDELFERLERRLPQLTAGRRDAPARHRTMRDAIAWSYDLLTPVEQAVLRSLSVFAGGCTLEAAEAVCDSTAGMSGNAPETFVVIESLIAQSLVRVGPLAGGERPRLVMLQTIHEFAAEQLAANGDDGPHRRHAAYFRKLAASIERGLLFGDFPKWNALLMSEHANLRAALDWAIAHEDAATALQLTNTLYTADWTSSANAQEKDRDLRCSLALVGGTPAARVGVMVLAAQIASESFDRIEAETLGQEALDIARQTGDDIGAACTHAALGALEIHFRDEARARTHLGEALVGYRRASANLAAAWILCDLAALDSRDAVDEGGEPEALALARARYSEAEIHFRAAEHPRGLFRSMHGLAYVSYKQRDLTFALASTQELLIHNWEVRAPVFSLLEDIADIAGRIGQPKTAAQLYGAADAVRERHIVPLEPQYRAEYERDAAVSRRALGEEAFAENWALGRTLSEGQAVAMALAVTMPQTEIAGIDSAAGPVVLSRRELQVMRLLATGLSDRAIAEQLFIGERTVNTHVAHIFAKLGVRNRAAAVTAAVTAGLVDPDSVKTDPSQPD